MKCVISILFYFIFCSGIKAQNLVPNPSFENYKSCPNGYIYSNNNVLQNWFIPSNDFNTDFLYFNVCSNNILNSVPQNRFGFENPATGNGYVGLVLFSEPNLRQYLSVRLNSILVRNQLYIVSLKYSCMDSLNIITKNFGLYFSDTAINSFTFYSQLTFIPQLRNNSGFLNKTGGWTILKFLYKANGTEQYLTMGNFDNDANSETSNSIGSVKNAGIFIDDVLVTPYNCFINPVKDTSICNGDTLHIALNNPTATYQWQDGSSAANYSITQPGNYTVTTTANGCIRQDTINVKPKRIIPFSLGANRSICSNEQLYLKAPSAYSKYLWQDGSSQSQYLVTQPGLYWLQAGIGNCSFRDSITLAGINCDCVPLVPSIFSPNGDGLNDGFVPIIKCNTTVYKLTIFNRFGQQVFNSYNPLQKWDGKFKNVPCSNGNYIYQLQYSSSNVPVQTIKGSILLVR